MPDDTWLAIVIGFSVAVAILLVALVNRRIHPVESQAPRTRTVRSERDEPRTPLGLKATRSRAWPVRSFGPWCQRHSVEDNLRRAFRRVDVVDPYALPRRIGSVLAETGLVTEDSVEPEPPAPRSPWPFGQVRRTEHVRDEK